MAIISYKVQIFIIRTIVSILINSLIYYVNYEFLIMCTLLSFFLSIYYENFKNIYILFLYFWITHFIFHYFGYHNLISFSYLKKGLFNLNVLYTLLYVSIVKHSDAMKNINNNIVKMLIIFYNKKYRRLTCIFIIFIFEYLLSYIFPSVIMRAVFSYSIFKNIKYCFLDEDYKILILSMFLANSISATINISSSFTNYLFINTFLIDAITFNNVLFLFKFVQMCFFAPFLTIVIFNYFLREIDLKDSISLKSGYMNDIINDNIFEQKNIFKSNDVFLFFKTIFLVEVHNFALKFYESKLEYSSFFGFLFSLCVIYSPMIIYFLFFEDKIHAIKSYYKEYKKIQWIFIVSQMLQMFLNTSVFLNIVNMFGKMFINGFIIILILLFTSFFVVSLAAKINILNILYFLNFNKNSAGILKDKLEFKEAKKVLKYYECANIFGSLFSISEKIFLEELTIESGLKQKIVIFFVLFNLIFCLLWWFVADKMFYTF